MIFWWFFERNRSGIILLAYSSNGGWSYDILCNGWANFFGPNCWTLWLVQPASKALNVKHCSRLHYFNHRSLVNKSKLVVRTISPIHLKQGNI